MSTVWVLNGPNLGRLGSREPDVYGATSYADLVAECTTLGKELAAVEVRQTDDEAELVGWLHEAADRAIPVLLNPAAFTHYSYAVRDACANCAPRSSRCNISNPARRRPSATTR